MTKTIQIKEHARLELMVDLYNLFNINPVLTRTVTVGAGYYSTGNYPAGQLREARCAIHVLVRHKASIRKA